jgi:polysaccharide export outer membrane protein
MTARFRSKNIARTLAWGLVASAMVAVSIPCLAQAKPAASQLPGPPQLPGAGAARAAAPSPIAPRAESVAAVPVPPEYVIGADDVLSIVFWRDKDMSSDVTVRPDGNISLPLLNEIHAAGLTPMQLKDRLIDESKKYVEDPNVTVVVKQINSRKVFITGEVPKPGPYLLSGPSSVLQLISLAGGLKDYAHSKKITILRTENGKPVSFRFNYEDVIEGKNLKQNIELKPGDTIIVP